MPYYHLTVFIGSLLLSFPAFACAELVDHGNRWQKVADGVETVNNEVWKFPCASQKVGFVVPEVTLTAYRFQRKKVEFVLLDPAEQLQTVDKKKDLGGTFLNRKKQFVRFGQNLGTISEFSQRSGDFSLNVPAGWWQEAASEPDGYLKIHGNVINAIFAKNQSAVICLDDRSLSVANDLGDTIVVWLYYNKGRYAYGKWPSKKRERFSDCKNIFQTGPRVVEVTDEREALLEEPAFADDSSIQCLKNEDKRAGVCARTASNPTRAAGLQRIILAADDRPDESLSERRRYYIIFFHSELPFYQIQSILLSDKFYGDAQPQWAVNLAGGERAGLSVRIHNDFVQYGNLESDLPSILSIRPRP